MQCVHPLCRGTLAVTHTYTVESRKYQRAVCSACLRVHSIACYATIATRGTGAKAQASIERKNQCATPS